LGIFSGIAGCASPQKGSQAKEIIDLFRQERKEEALVKVDEYISKHNDWWVKARNEPWFQQLVSE